MYSNSTKRKSNHSNVRDFQYPFYSSCNSSTLKAHNKIMSSTTLITSIPESVADSNTSNGGKEEYSVAETSRTPPLAVRSTYWSLTFSLIMAPFIVSGCPFYVLTAGLPPEYPRIRSTRLWLKRIFDCASFPCSSMFTCILLLVTSLYNVYFLYLLVKLTNSLFIAGVYEQSMFKDMMDVIRDIPVVIPLNYVWLRGYKINSLICMADEKHRKFSHVDCSYRVRIFLMTIVIVCVHTIRYFNYQRYIFTDMNWNQALDEIWQLAIGIFNTLLLPIYCTFCYTVRFELLIIKSTIYETVRDSIKPQISHLNKFKTLYTNAADHIDTINSLFSLYMSIALILIVIGTIIDAEHLITALLTAFYNSIYGPGNTSFSDTISSFFNTTLTTLQRSLDPLKLFPHHRQPQKANETLQAMDPVLVRQVNADVLCIVLTYALVFFTVWQAVGVNDCARSLHVWLNDFVMGAGGTDVHDILRELGVEQDEGDDDNDFQRKIVSPNALEKKEVLISPVWAKDTQIGEGMTDEFMEKFGMLKAYIHTRMQLEKASLLNISLVGLVLPSLRGRLKRYNVIF